MKTLDWQQALDRLAREGKRVFTNTELSNVANVTPHALNVELGRLVKKGVVLRFAKGKYGLATGASAEDLVAATDSAAYITGFYALHRHHCVTQMPSEITCFTNRRHNRSRVRETPLGRFVFVCVGPRIYSKPSEDLVAPMEQAFCDFVFLSCLRGISPETLVTFRRLGDLDDSLLESRLRQYPRSVARKAWQILGT